MIAAVCLTIAVCIAPTPTVPTEPSLVADAQQAEDRAALREIAHAYQIVAYVDALTTPTTSERRVTAPLTSSWDGHDEAREVTGTRRPPSAGPVTSQSCGGDLPDCSIMACESGGNPTAQNPTSSASGLWQIVDGTWNGFGGYAHASDAPVEVQNEKARQLWAGGAGRSHWSSCD